MKIDRQVLLRKIMDVGDEVRRLEQDLIALQSIDIVGYPENYSNISHQASIRSEHISRRLRELVYSTTNVDWLALLEDTANELGITVEYNSSCDNGDGVISNITNDSSITCIKDFGSIDITIPCLIPGRKKKPTEYITAPLYAALERFIKESEANQSTASFRLFERFDECVIWITHIYDRQLTARGRKRDYDNIETKAIIDVINAFLLTDDNGLLCNVYHTSEISDKDLTRISVMTKDVFYKRVLDMKNS